MRFKTLIAAPIAIAAIVTIPEFTPDSFGVASEAWADTDISFSISTFHNDLAPYGSWTNVNNGYVFVPEVDADWRPYSVGHWEYTDRYGWLWVSEEPFGWATTHYGRWGRSDDIGWYWVPGRKWAPAWVSWRRSNNHVAWAPLPPDRGGVDVAVSINVGDIPNPYWNVVPARNFLERDLRRSIIRDERQRLRYINEARPIGNVRIQNNIVVNNVIDVRYVERETRRQVRPIRVREVNDPRQAGRREGNAVAIFQRDAAEAREQRPRQVRNVEEIRKIRQQRRANRNNNDRQDNQAVSPEDTTGSTTRVPNTAQDQARPAQQRQRNNNQAAEPGDATGSATVPSDDRTDQTNRQRQRDRQRANQQRRLDQQNNGAAGAAQDSGENATDGQATERPANRAQQRRNRTDDNRQNANQRRQQQQQPTERNLRRKNQQNNNAVETRGSSRRDSAQPNQRRRQNDGNAQNQRRRDQANQKRATRPAQGEQQRVRPRDQGKQQAPQKRRQRGGDQNCDPNTQDC